MPLFLIPLILQIIAQLPAFIKMAEQAFSGAPGNSQAKKDLVMSGVTTALDIEQTIAQKPLAQDHIDAIISSVGKMTDATVSVFNAVGVFTKSSPSATIVNPPALQVVPSGAVLTPVASTPGLVTS